MKRENKIQHWNPMHKIPHSRPIKKCSEKKNSNLVVDRSMSSNVQWLRSCQKIHIKQKGTKFRMLEECFPINSTTQTIDSYCTRYHPLNPKNTKNPGPQPICNITMQQQVMSRFNIHTVWFGSEAKRRLI